MHIARPVLLFQAIRAINGGDHETSAEEFTNRVFNKIDVNGDGEKRPAAAPEPGAAHRAVNGPLYWEGSPQYDGISPLYSLVLGSILSMCIL